MILIADSGSTKTDWCVVLNGTVIKRLGTKGINPFFQSEEEIQQKPDSFPSASTAGREIQCSLLLRSRLYTRESSRPPTGYCRQSARYREY